ncbi:lipopolysaccharide biosynthesis protein [Steroidobacter agaridevorans]|uniref:lipopolysaccharide biosynthesis protein n=1 Tax=Steroidobacter agaridevorans TaxID=2695856 RepID=UPI00137B7513|nr:lipopolysaccharide biosynthesis protein [Steroidobacter agaridevorans]
MSLAQKAVTHTSWFALFKMISQVLSWGVTVVVARLLSPVDYALSAMATLITGYAELLSEMGIGASIIQKKEPTESELSSIFWFSLGVGVLFALACIPIAFITAEIFDEPDVIPLILSISVLFVFTGLQVVPLSLLKRDLNYKAVGLIEMQTTIISCLGMLVIAYFGGGVWTLIGGRLIRGVVRLVLVYRTTTWRPKLNLNFAETKGYLSFGIMVAASSSAYYMFEVADRFFAGRAWTAEALGFYLFALQLAQVPTEKLTSSINQVTYSLFSRYQDDLRTFSDYYLKTIKLTAALVFPIFVSGFLLGDQLIPILLGDKWVPMSTLFKFLCLAQILVTLNAVVGFLHMALGKPIKGLYFNVACAVLMSVSYFFAVDYEKEAILIPWFTTYLLITLVWLGTTNATLGISTSRYLGALRMPVLGVAVIVAIDYGLGRLEQNSGLGVSIMLPVKILCSALGYGLFFWLFDRTFLTSIRSLKKQPATAPR